MRQALQNAVGFARFCAEYNTDPTDTAQLIAAVERSVRAYERNAPREKYEGLLSAVETIATGLGFDGLDWPGLYPTLHKNGNTSIMLPGV